MKKTKINNIEEIKHGENRYYKCTKHNKTWIEGADFGDQPQAGRWSKHYGACEECVKKEYQSELH